MGAWTGIQSSTQAGASLGPAGASRAESTPPGQVGAEHVPVTGDNPSLCLVCLALLSILPTAARRTWYITSHASALLNTLQSHGRSAARTLVWMETVVTDYASC